MDIILTPTKLNGTTQARPSAVDLCFHDIAGGIARIQRSGNEQSVFDLSDSRILRFEIDPSDIERIRNCLAALKNGDDRIDCGDSLKALYIILPLAAAMKRDVSFVGDASLSDKLIGSVSDILNKHGVVFSKGNLKIRRRDRGKYEEIVSINGSLEYGHFSLNGKEDPWFLCGLLCALPLLEGNSSIRMTTLPDSSELAHIAVNVLKQYGIYIDSSVNEYGYPNYEIPGSQNYNMPEDPETEGDWTGAAFWLGCGALGGNVTVRGLTNKTSQSSRQILDKLHTLGAAAGMGEDVANVTAASLSCCNINAGHIPYIIPALSVCLASASGTSRLTDLGSFDPDPVISVLNKLGAEVSREGSSLRFNGQPVLSGGDVGHCDDPVAIMVATAASCVCGESVLIRNAGIINKYYPDFFDEFVSLGGRIRVLP